MTNTEKENHSTTVGASLQRVSSGRGTGSEWCMHSGDCVRASSLKDKRSWKISGCHEEKGV